MSIKNICVFCGSSVGNNPQFANAARALGKLMVEQNLGLVYGAGKIGMMGAIADSVLENGGSAIGVIPTFLRKKERSHTGLTEIHIVNSMHERKKLMFDLSQAFVAMPGGFGTLDELCEIITWAQLGLHNYPIALLNVNGFFDTFISYINQSVEHGFIPAAVKQLILVEEQPEALLRAIQQKSKELENA